MTTYLLDANVLIALAVEDHPHHEGATRWIADIDHFAVCPIVDGALVRLIFRMGAPAGSVNDSLRHLRERRGYLFWADLLFYADVDLEHVRGHRQATDAYLAALAGSHPDGRPAPLDEGLAAVLPKLTLLIPAASRPTVLTAVPFPPRGDMPVVGSAAPTPAR